MATSMEKQGEGDGDEVVSMMQIDEQKKTASEEADFPAVEEKVTKEVKLKGEVQGPGGDPFSPAAADAKKEEDGADRTGALPAGGEENRREEERVGGTDTSTVVGEERREEEESQGDSEGSAQIKGNVDGSFSGTSPGVGIDSYNDGEDKKDEHMSVVLQAAPTETVVKEEEDKVGKSAAEKKRDDFDVFDDGQDDAGSGAEGRVQETAPQEAREGEEGLESDDIMKACFGSDSEDDEDVEDDVMLSDIEGLDESEDEEDEDMEEFLQSRAGKGKEEKKTKKDKKKKDKSDRKERKEKKKKGKKKAEVEGEEMSEEETKADSLTREYERVWQHPRIFRLPKLFLSCVSLLFLRM